MAPTGMSLREKITLGLLFVMTTLLYADQLIMSAILPELSKEYAVSETTLGLIGSGFTLVGALISIVFGFFSDRAPRKALMVLVIMVGEIPCILTGVPYFTSSIESFTILRILSGIGLGGIMPITLSVLADFFREENRASASAWMITAWSVGSVLGVEVAGFLTNDFGWRLPFILIGVPNIPLAIIFALYAREPERGRTEEALEALIQKGLVYKQKIKLSDFGLIFTNKTNIYTFLQGLPGTVPWGILTYWLINFFETHRGVSKEMASLIFLVLGIGSLLGGLGFAYVGEWLYKKQPRYMPLMCGAGVLLGIIPSFLLINMSLENMTLYLALGFFTGFLVSVASANVNAILMNVNRPEHRGSVFAVFNITNNLGQGLGPAIGGLLIPLGQIFMMNFAILWWVPCGLLLLAVARYITADRESLRKLLGERAAQMQAQARG
ncbi:MAG: MFS transporter [Spirochaetes bacterium]|nr:MAG: MFS transporter [Spirochaetota bacterium]